MREQYYNPLFCEESICTLEILNKMKKELRNPKTYEMFFYLLNNIIDNDTYEIIHYKITENNFGLFMFEKDQLIKLFQAVKNSEFKLQAYIKYNHCNIEYIRSNSEDNEEKEFVIIESGQSNSAYYDGKNLNLNKKINSKLVIYDEKNIYCNRNSKFFPANLKSFNWVNSDVIKLIMDYYSNKNIFWKDVLKDYLNNKSHVNSFPIQLSLIWESHSKKELFEKRFNIELDNAINKYSIFNAYLMANAMKYVKKEEYQKLKSLSNKELIKCCSVNDLFEMYYKKHLKNYIDDCDHHLYIEDYCFMSIKMKKTFNLKIKSFNRLVNEHNELAIIYNSKFVKKIKIPENSVFLKLKLPKEYKLIKTKKALIEEAVLNRNCVASYDDKINKGSSVIYTRIYKDKRYTIEIKKKTSKGKHTFYVNQLYGKKNSKAPEELHNELNSLIKDENERIKKLK